MTRTEKILLSILTFVVAPMLLMGFIAGLEVPSPDTWGIGAVLVGGVVCTAIIIVLIRRDRKKAVMALLFVLALAPMTSLIAHNPQDPEEEVILAAAVGLLFFCLAWGLVSRKWGACGAGIVLGLGVLTAYICVESNSPSLFVLYTVCCAILLVWLWWYRRRRRGDVLLAAGRMCATLARRGLPLAQGIAELSRDAPRKHRKVLERLAQRLQEGRSLSEAMAEEWRVFPPVYVSLVRAGERSGTVDRVLARMEESEGIWHKTYADVSVKLIYPVAVGMFVVLATAFWAVKIGPQMEWMSREVGAEDVSEGRFTVTGDPFLDGIVILILAAMAPLYLLALCGAVDWMFRTARLGEKVRLLLPIVGRGERELTYAHFASILAGVLESGASTREAMEIACELDVLGGVRKGLAQAREAHLEGRSLSEASGRLSRCPTVLMRAIEGGERAGGLIARLDHAAWVLAGRLQRRMEWVGDAVLPAAIPLVGLLVYSQGRMVVTLLTRMMFHYADWGTSG